MGYGSERPSTRLPASTATRRNLCGFRYVALPNAFPAAERATVPSDRPRDSRLHGHPSEPSQVPLRCPTERLPVAERATVPSDRPFGSRRPWPPAGTFAGSATLPCRSPSRSGTGYRSGLPFRATVHETPGSMATRRNLCRFRYPSSSRSRSRRVFFRCRPPSVTGTKSMNPRLRSTR